MEALYDRMATSITNNPNLHERKLATRILQCLTCSTRLLSVSEMAHALGDDALGILDLQQTIGDLCGGFAAVDHDGNVSIIHHSAREYLLVNSEQRMFGISRTRGHRDLFLSSMRCLMSTGLRAKLGRDQAHDFLGYAAVSWSHHLLNTATLDEETLSNLKRFLTGNWMLTWIHALATTGQLRVLAQASKDLSKLARRSRQHATLDISEQELISSWSVDLLRIMGRYGSLLRRKPDSIYNSIAPFCTKGSSIHQLFGRFETLSVGGISTEKWDDLFARISLGKSFSASIQAAGPHVAVLAAPGDVHIYEASDFRETKGSPIQHGERVDRIQLNKTATLLASYGYRTLKVWNVSTGECILSVASVESKTRPLAMLFINNDSTLLVGSDDRRVRSLSIREAEPQWKVIADLEEFGLEKHFTNSASHMALNPDGSMITVGYRRHPASAWEIEGSTHIGHCRRKDDVSMVRELRDIVWHPYQPEVLGLNVEGVVFRWAPYEDRVDELSADAAKLAISSDGELFVTGDAHGRVNLYTTAGFSLLYHLSSQEAVFGLAFSPDSKRFYDIRGFHANAWEPNALVRHAENSGDVDSASEYSMSHVSERSARNSAAVDPITALAGSPSGRLYCYGTQKGVVTLNDTRKGKIATIYSSRANFAIEHIAWSDDGRHICISDFSKQLVVFASSNDLAGYEQTASIPMRKITKNPISQLLFHRMSSHIVVCTSTQIYTICLTSYAVENSKDLGSAISCWMLHPTDSTLLVGFGAHDITVLDWNLVEQRILTLDWPRQPGVEKQPTITSLRVDRVLSSHDNDRLLLQVSNADESQDSQLAFLGTPDLLSSDRSGDEAGTPWPTVCIHRMQPETYRDVSLALGLIWGDRLIYVSRDFAICSKQLQWASESTVSSSPVQTRNPRNARARALARVGASTGGPDSGAKELFALPGDWVNEQALALCSLWGVETSLLYPRNGEVAVVKCAALCRG